MTKVSSGYVFQFRPRITNVGDLPKPAMQELLLCCHMKLDIMTAISDNHRLSNTYSTLFSGKGLDFCTVNKITIMFPWTPRLWIILSVFFLKINLFWWSLWSNNHCYLVLLPPWFEEEKLIQECKLSRICNCVLHQSAGPRPMLGMSHTLQSTLNPVLYTTRTDQWSVQ